MTEYLPGRRIIGELSPPPSAYMDSVDFRFDGADVELRSRYERDGGLVDGGLRFHRVRGFRFRAEAHCTVWHVDAYDMLVEIEPSDWVRELIDVDSSTLRAYDDLHHFLIYIDDHGAYEFAATAVEWLPESLVSEGAA